MTAKKSPCGGCKDKASIKVPVTEYRELNRTARTVADLKSKLADAKLALANARRENRDRDAWRESGQEHGYRLAHNPETCDECYAAQLEKDGGPKTVEELLKTPTEGDITRVWP